MHFCQQTDKTHKPKFFHQKPVFFFPLSYNLLLAESLILPSLSLIYLSIMEIIASIIQIIPNLCTQISHQTEYVRHLKNNVEALMEEARKLKALCKDTESEEREASRGRQKLTNQAQTWLDQARAILAEIDNIKSQFDQRRTFCNGCFPDLCSDYTLGKRAFKMLERVRQVIGERSGIKLLAMSSPPRVMEMDVPTVGQSSSQQTMAKIWDLLHDEHTSVICVHGMGGIGKTTLMKAINNKLKATEDFKYVIWVTVSNVSKELILQRVQKDIMDWLRLGFNENASSQDRSTQLRQYLSNNRYMLILDDLWNPIDLSEIGIPTNKENRSKIAITTRLFEVCTDMKADAKIRVNTLTEAEAWDLFAANVGKEVAHRPQIKDIAKNVAMECGGLPLAIMAVAKAMQGQQRKELWEDALTALRASVPEIRGMELEVFRPLKLSYDDIKNEKVKMCFLFCSLFPEDYEFSVKELIGLWIMEGFIDNFDNLVVATNKGHRIIEELKRRCLLEEGIEEEEEDDDDDIIDDGEEEDDDIIDDGDDGDECDDDGEDEIEDADDEFQDEDEDVVDDGDSDETNDITRDVVDSVKMHDITRGLALYIASSSCTEGPKFLVKAGKALEAPPREETWREFERISLMMTGITELPVKPECPNLISLLLRDNPICAVPHSFFELMPALQVLDLSYTSITSLSVSSSSLLNLRALILIRCRELTEVPFLGKLKELQFLDIKSSGIISLPEEMQNLVKLKKLNMSKLLSDSFTIPSNVISVLSSLEDLRMHRTNVNWAKGSEFAVQNDVTLGEGRLKQLTILKITIKDFDCVEEDVFLQQLPKLKRFKVLIGPCDNLNMNCMKQVHINGGNNYPCGVKVMVTHTEGLKLTLADVKDVSQLVGDAKGLQMLNISRCRKMEWILDWSDAGENALQNIEELHLSRLSSLQKLFKGEEPRRCLRKLNKIYLNNCNNLKSLFSSKTVQNLDQLQTLHVRDCGRLEEIIEGHDKSLPENPFPQLCNFTVEWLPKLKSIIRRDTLALPSLIKLKIRGCPDLRLPKRPDTTDWPSITEGDATWQRWVH